MTLPDDLRVLVCGGRDYDGWKSLQRHLSDLHESNGIALVISGGAKGADQLAERWANHNRTPLCVFPANWNFVGRSAGPVRNASMLKFGKPDLVLAFPGGRGTANMIEQAERFGVQVIKVKS